jgi:hypothetical protein
MWNLANLYIYIHIYIYIYIYIHFIYIYIKCIYKLPQSYYMYICVWIYICMYIYIYNGILLSHKENEIMTFVGKWMQLEIIRWWDKPISKGPHIMCSHSFVSPRPEMIMVMIMIIIIFSEYVWGLSGVITGKGKEMMLNDKVFRIMLHIYIWI